MSPKDHAKDLRLRREFHITLEQWRAIYDYQNGCCAMCERPASDFKNGLSLDHDHKTGLIRGLLCHICNRVLGKFRDNNSLLCAASGYVTHPPAIQALGALTFTVVGRIGTKVRAKKLAAAKGVKFKGSKCRKANAVKRKSKSRKIMTSSSSITKTPSTM